MCFGGCKKGAKWGRERTVFCSLETFIGTESDMRLHERVEGNVLVRRKPRKLVSRGVLADQKRVCVVWGVVRPPLLRLSEALAMCLDPLRRVESHSTVSGCPFQPSQVIKSVHKSGRCDRVWSRKGGGQGRSDHSKSRGTFLAAACEFARIHPDNAWLKWSE